MDSVVFTISKFEHNFLQKNNAKMC